MPLVTTKTLKANLLAHSGRVSFKYYIGNSIEIDEYSWPRNTYERLEHWIE